jgi:hypothetical protein
LYAAIAMTSYWLFFVALLFLGPSNCFKAHVPQTAMQLHTLQLTIYPQLLIGQAQQHHGLPSKPPGIAVLAAASGRPESISWSLCTVLFFMLSAVLPRYAT